MYNKASRVMNKENQDLRNKIESNKNFLNMVIHDLKHPVEAINIKLKHFIEQLDSNIYTVSSPNSQNTMFSWEDVEIDDGVEENVN